MHYCKAEQATKEEKKMGESTKRPNSRYSRVTVRFRADERKRLRKALEKRQTEVDFIREAVAERIQQLEAQKKATAR
jgi:hypothetical protein